MTIDYDISKIPLDLKIHVTKVIEELEKIKKTNKMGLNITNLKKRTKLSNTSMTKALSSLMTIGIVDMEEVGNSKLYYLKGDI